MKNLILLFLFSSCTFKTLIVSNASYLAANRVGNKIDLNWTQEKKLRKDIDILLKRNISEIKKLKTIVDDIGVSELEAISLLNRFFPVYERLYMKFIPLMTKLMSHYSQKQIKNLFSIAEDDNKTIENRVTKNKTSEYVKRFEFFFGDISKEQKEMLHGNKKIFQKINERKLAQRIHFQEKLRKAFLVSENSKRETSLNQIFSENLSRIEFEQRLLSMNDLLVKLRTSLSEKQKKHFNEKKSEISEWLKLFIEKYEVKA